MFVFKAFHLGKKNLQVLGVSLTSLKFLLNICLLIALNLTTQTQYN